jgi:hypothetical protein
LFYNDTGLKNLKEIPSTVIYIQTMAFYGCKGLTELDIKSTNLKNIYTNAFYNCTNLAKLIVRTVTPPTLASNMFYGSKIASGTGYIYVPDERLQAYKGGINWSQYASQIKPRSEIP